MLSAISREGRVNRVGLEMTADKYSIGFSFQGTILFILACGHANHDFLKKPDERNLLPILFRKSMYYSTNNSRLINEKVGFGGKSNIFLNKRGKIRTFGSKNVFISVALPVTW